MRLNEATKILDLKSPFSAMAAKKAYRKLALKAHPDKGGSTTEMQLINIAYELCCKGITWASAPPIEFKFVKPKPNLSSVVSWFGKRMLFKLGIKNRGFSYREDAAEFLFGKLVQECVELRAEIGKMNKENIIDECADVANFAMMIADKARRKL